MTSCLLCAHDLTDATPVATHARYGVECPRVACARCGLVQHATRPTPAALATYYATRYRAENPPLPMGGAMPGTPEYEAALEDVAVGRVALAQMALDGLTTDGAPRIVEIGCGDGRTSAALMRAGASVVAVEADPGMRAEAEKRGVVAVDPDSTPSGVDLVVAFHVLEHDADPVRMLTRLREHVVRPGGRIAIEVPNVESPYGESLGSWFFQWAHVVDFSSRTLRATLLAAGWVSVQVVEQGSVLVAIAVAPDAMLAPPPREAACVEAGADAAHASATIAGLRDWDEARRCERTLDALVNGGEMPSKEAIVEAVIRVHGQGAKARHSLRRLLASLTRFTTWLEEQDRAIDYEQSGDAARAYQAGRSQAFGAIGISIGHIANGARAESAE